MGWARLLQSGVLGEGNQHVVEKLGPGQSIAERGSAVG
jgi:hypothetical protein